MDNKAIIIKNLSKCYPVDNNKNSAKIGNWLSTKTHHKFYALKNINLNVEKGEMIGIIGPNGAGKSTLIKILAEVTPPSYGQVMINGKVASILEIGIGFQPELSGSDNIFLSGEMYGLSRKEILLKHDKIIGLFGFPEFLNTAVKYYSSGMYMRLAFSIIINVDADIYLFDEVLSVGDQQFQVKALQEIEKLKNKGATVFVVTHTPHTIIHLSNKMCLLNNGEVEFYGSPAQTLKAYKKMVSRIKKDDMSADYFLNESELSIKKNIAPSDKNIHFELLEMQVSNENLNNNNELFCSHDLTFRIKMYYHINYNFKIYYHIKDQYETVLVSHFVDFNAVNQDTHTQIKLIIPQNTFNPSKYILDIFVIDNKDEIITGYHNLMHILLLDENEETSSINKAYINIPLKVIIE